MKRIKKWGYIILLVILAVLSFAIYANASKDNGETQKEKAFSEIQFLETKFVNLFNTMNNIETRNYSVVTSELSKKSTEKSKDKSSSSKSGSKDTSSGQEGKSNSEETEMEDEQDKKKFELKSNGILTKTEDINWDSVKSEVEILYTSLPSITMDLYQFNINQEDILGFNTDYDKLTSSVKNENKEETLTQLATLYEYLPKFLKGSGQQEIYTILVETKKDVLKGYAKLDSQSWQEISNDVSKAIETYSKLLTNTQIQERKQYNMSKGYIMINELQNAVNLQDSSVFLIKYKNLLEEINNIG